MALQQVGVRAVIQDVARFLSSIDKMNLAVSSFGRNAAKDIKASSKSMQEIGLQATIAGGAITGFGLAGVKLAADFEVSLSRIAGLTNAPRESLAALEQGILDMSQALPKTPQELGSAAYFILSSGIEDTATAMEILELSAKASAAGLGETKTIADALTSVMNAYQLSAADAGRATDTLVNIVKFGKGEPTELATALGRIIPVAAQMGVEFEQLGAVIATLTNTGLSAEESVIALRGIFAQLLSPTEDSIKLFAQLGINMEDFRKEVNANFIGAMTKLIGRIDELGPSIGGSEAAISRLFPEVRGMIGVMAAFGNQLEDTKANLKGIEEGAGSLDTAFDAASQTLTFQLNQIKAQLAVVAIEIGQDLAPAVLDLTAALGAMLNVWSALPAPLREVAARFGFMSGGLALVSGGFLILLPQIVEGIRAMRALQAQAGALGTTMRALPFAFAGLAAISVGLTVIPPLIGAITRAFSDPTLQVAPDKLAAGVERLTRRVRDLRGSTNDIEDLGTALNDIVIEFGIEDLFEPGDSAARLAELRDEVTGLDATTRRLLDTFASADLGTGILARSGVGPATKELNELQADLLAGIEAVQAAGGGYASVFLTIREALVGVNAGTAEQNRQYEEMLSNLPAVKAKLDEINAAYVRTIPSAAESAQEQREFIRGVRELDEVAASQTNRLGELAGVASQLIPAFEGTGEATELLTTRFIDAAQKEGITGDKAKELASQLRALGLKGLAAQIDSELGDPVAAAARELDAGAGSALNFADALAQIKLVGVFAQVQAQAAALRGQIDALLPSSAAFDRQVGVAIELQVPEFETAELEEFIEKVMTAGDVLKNLGPILQGITPTFRPFVAAVVTAADTIDSLGPILQRITPQIDETFDHWRERVERMAKSFRNFGSNQQKLLDRLVAANVEGAEEIVAAISKEGPEALAQWEKFFAEDPFEALKFFTDVAPDIMGQAAKDAADAVAQANQDAQEAVARSFNEWKAELQSMADAYANFASNQKKLNDILVNANVEGAGDIAQAIADQGPEALANWLKFFVEQPTEALEAFRDAAPALMGEATKRTAKEIADANIEELRRVREANERELIRVAEANEREMERVRKANEKAISGSGGVVDRFKEWRDQLIQTAKDYKNFKTNLATILEGLKAANIDNIDAIILAIEQKGPTYAAGFAQWFQERPQEAIETLRDAGPAIFSDFVKNSANAIIAQGPAFEKALYDSVIVHLDALEQTGDEGIKIKFLGDPTNFLNTQAIVQAAIAKGLDPSTIPSFLDTTVRFFAEGLRGSEAVQFYLGLEKLGVLTPELRQLLVSIQLRSKALGYAHGDWDVGGPRGAGDVVPAMLTPGEMVLPRDYAERFRRAVTGVGGLGRALAIIQSGALGYHAGGVVAPHRQRVPGGALPNIGPLLDTLVTDYFNQLYTLRPSIPAEEPFRALFDKFQGIASKIGTSPSIERPALAAQLKYLGQQLDHSTHELLLGSTLEIDPKQILAEWFKRALDRLGALTRVLELGGRLSPLARIGSVATTLGETPHEKMAELVDSLERHLAGRLFVFLSKRHTPGERAGFGEDLIDSTALFGDSLDTFRAGIAQMITWPRTSWGAIRESIGKIFDAIAERGGPIFSFAQGGFVPAGQEVLAQLHGPEAIVPLRGAMTASAPGLVVNISAPVNVTINEMNWARVRSVALAALDEALGSARSTAIRQGVPLSSGIS